MNKLFFILLLCITGCSQSFRDKQWYEKISGIKFPEKFEVVETGALDYASIAVLMVDSQNLKSFVATNHFDSLKNLNELLPLIAESTLKKYKPNLQSTKGIYLLNEISKTVKEDSWVYVADINRGLLWVQVKYPDFSGN